MKKFVNGVLSLCMVVALCFTTLYMPLSSKKAEAAEGAVYVNNSDKRQKINFNRNWKFIRQDAEGADEVNYDDSGWVSVGLPHNFSIPYNMETNYYAGYGWYRKAFDVNEDWNGKRISIEFEGVFQVAEVYVNGKEVGTHEGGYTGFEYDITDYIHTGSNEVAVRVNNIWQHDLAPRGGDHQYTGGIYRDVYLNVMEDVHVTWYGTYVTTPDITNPGWDESAKNIDFGMYPTEDEVRANVLARRSNVAVQTEVKNDSSDSKSVNVTQTVVDEDNKIVAEFSSESKTLVAGETGNFYAESAKLNNIELWSPDNPYMYKVYTNVYSNGAVVDTYESPLGFRWVQWLNDGFYLNGEKTFIYGANAHQDHGGWCDAVSDAGFYSDVSMIKEAGMNFIRGSHYPHDPSYTEACDKIGIMYWSENCFWAYGGGGGKDADPVGDASDWMKDPYPQSAQYEEAFEQSCMDSLRDMIRINRNHPSVVNWSMGNEVFFTGYKTQDKCKALVNKMRNYSHELDPTRKAAMGGVQRNDYDKLSICDIAGYNGDGATLYDNRDMPNIVSEYSSKTADRPGEFRPYYADCQAKGDIYNYSIYPNSAGLVLWCAFHHGTIAGSSLARMGFIDYYRLPLQSWYWYRENMGSGDIREASVKGEASQINLETSSEYITNDGKKDAKLIVTLADESGTWVNDTRNVTLSVKSGPGIFPGGKNYTFIAGDTIRDGRAAIEFRSYYSGDTVIVASAEGLPETEIKLHTTDVTGDEIDTEPEDFYNAKRWNTATDRVSEPYAYGADNIITNHPLFPSSGQLTRVNAADGNTSTLWTADISGSGQYMMTDLEIAQNIYKARLDFGGKAYPYTIEVSMDGETWTTAAQQTVDTLSDRPSEETINGLPARYVKVTFNNVPDGEFASLAELSLYGNVNSQAPRYDIEGVAFENESIAANSEKVVKLDEKYSRFEGNIGLDSDSQVKSATDEANVKIYADDSLVFDGIITTGNTEKLNFSVNGIKELKFIVANEKGNQGILLSDAMVYGAIRDISNNKSISQNCRILYRSLDSMLRAGTTYKSSIDIKASNALANSARGILGLYDASGKLLDLVKMSADNQFSISIPDKINGYEAKLRIYNAATMGMLSKTTAITRDSNNMEGQSGNRLPNNSNSKIALLSSIDSMLLRMENKDYSIVNEQAAATASYALSDACDKYASVESTDDEIDLAKTNINNALILLDDAYVDAMNATKDNSKESSPVIDIPNSNAKPTTVPNANSQSESSVPSKIRGLKQKKASITGITLVWTAVSGATSYKIERYNAKTKTWKLIKSTVKNIYEDKKLKMSKVYKYRVTAVNASGVGASTKILAATCPKKVKFSVDRQRSKLIVKWKKTVASGIRIYVKEGNGKYKKAADVKNGKTKYVIKKLKKTKKYSIKLIPYCRIQGNKVITGKALVKK